jgi:hypothetical protein
MGWFHGILIFISCYWLVRLSFIQQCILVSVKFCASSRGYTLEAFELVWCSSFMFVFGFLLVGLGG